MSRPDIKNLNDLNDYLIVLEERIAELENQDQIVKSAINDINQDLQDCMNIDIDIPRIGLLSCNFFTRAFTVWGHYFVAQLIIGLIVAIVYIALFVFILGNSLNF